MTNNLGELTESDKAKIDQLTENISDKREIAKILYHYLQDATHYVNVSIEHGGMLPHDVSYVCETRYGDCKDLTTYMKAMLKYKGITSNYLLINSGTKYEKVIPECITNQFDHVILCIPNVGDTIWLECTSKLLPFNELGTFTQNRIGLLVDGENSRLLKTPSLINREVKNSYSYDFFEESKERSKLKGTVSRGIYTSNNLHDDLISMNEKDLLENLANYIPISNVQLSKFDYETKNRDSINTVFSYEAICPNPFYEISNFLKINHPYTHLPEFEKPSARKNAVRFFFPIAYADTVVYHHNFCGFELKSDSLTFENTEFGLFKIQRSLSDSTLTVIRELSLLVQRVSIEKYPIFHDFTKSIHEELNSTLTQLNIQ